MTFRTQTALAADDATYFFKCFATSTGNSQMASTGYSSTNPGIFFVTPSTANAPAGVVMHRINMSIIDDQIRPERFGGLGTLANGMKIEVTTSTGGVVFDFLDGTTLKNNAGWALLVGSESVTTIPAAGQDAFMVMWAVAQSGRPLLLKQGQQFRFTLQDPSSGMNSWFMMAQGYYETDRTL